MRNYASISRLGSEFDGFLLAPIGEDRNGMLLTVLSALARLDVDPWQEASELAGLPGETATQRLASLIASLPEEPSTHRDPGTIAGRLIALLPRPARSKIPLRETLIGAGSVTISRVAIYVISMVFVLGIQWIVAHRLPPAEVDNARAPASSTSAQIPPRSFGR